jgi:hypothetical protein
VLFRVNARRLAELAHRALLRGMSTRDFAVVCIDVDDPDWHDLACYLMPENDWDEIRSRGDRPVARGTVTRSIAEYVSLVCPDVADALRRPLPDGLALVYVLGDGGCDVNVIEPMPEPS